ncbi:MAG: Uncharacterized protein G01um101438_659 [Parcubacteria group bacterium Gr01-1014_38]|nr:MAG: Uncharacterized protein G01um101438_659 [Parcubacteria group bacterium Gr01-1014_38]
MSIYDQFASNIIKEQESIMGPLAWEQASKVTGLRVDIQAHTVNVEGNSKEVLEKLVAQYGRLFGPASREVCRDAIRSLLSQVAPDEIPAVLR